MSELLALPKELQQEIFMHLYTSGIKLKECTSLFLVCRELYEVAHPILWAYYPFECIPLKPGQRGVYHGRSGGDILKIIRTGDCTSIGHHICNEEWMEGYEEEIKTLFDDHWDDVLEAQRIRDEEEAAESSEDDCSLFEPDQESDGVPSVWYFTDEEDDDDYRSGSGQMNKRGRHAGKFMIRRNSFVQFLRKLGPEKAAKIEHLRIIWDHDEHDFSNYVVDAGPSAIAMVSVICKLWLPGLRVVALRQVHENEQGEDGCTRECPLSTTEGVRDPAEWWSPQSKTQIMEDMSTLVKAIDLLGKGCSQMTEFRYEDWHVCQGSSVARDEWFGDLIRRTGLKTIIERKYPQPETSDILVFKS